MIKGIVMLAALCVGGAALAQTPPGSASDPLQDICTGFLAQSGAGVAGDQARLCTCLVGETQKQLTRDEMLTYSNATQSGQQPPPAIVQKVVAIATMCLTQAR